MFNNLTAFTSAKQNYTIVHWLSAHRGRPGSMQNAVDLYWTQIADRDTSLISWLLPQPTQVAWLECFIRTLVWDYDIWPWYVQNLCEVFWDGRKGWRGWREGETECPSARPTVIPALSFPGGGSSQSQLLEGKMEKENKIVNGTGFTKLLHVWNWTKIFVPV